MLPAGEDFTNSFPSNFPPAVILEAEVAGSKGLEVRQVLPL